MKLGISSYAFAWSIGVPGAMPDKPLRPSSLLHKALELGVSVVQFGPNLPLDPLSEAEFSALVKLAQSNGLELEYGTRGLDSGDLRKQIQIACRLSSKILRTVPMEEVGQRFSVEAIAMDFRALIPELEATGVSLAIENGNLPALDLRRLIELIGHPQIGITLDTANSIAVPEGTRYVVEILAKHTLCFHVKDFVVRRAWHRMGFVVEGVPAGRGQMELEWMLAQLRASESNANAILELWPPVQSTIEETIALEHRWAIESIQYLRKFIPA
jgi:sugar phosphate isomerase/epimerase